MSKGYLKAHRIVGQTRLCVRQSTAAPEPRLRTALLPPPNESCHVEPLSLGLALCPPWKPWSLPGHLTGNVSPRPVFQMEGHWKSRCLACFTSVTLLEPWPPPAVSYIQEGVRAWAAEENTKSPQYEVSSTLKALPEQLRWLSSIKQPNHLAGKAVEDGVRPSVQCGARNRARESLRRGVVCPVHGVQQDPWPLPATYQRRSDTTFSRMSPHNSPIENYCSSWCFIISGKTSWVETRLQRY